MLKTIISNEFERVVENEPNNKILESDKRLNELVIKLKFIDKELFFKLDEEIGTSISLNSRYYFNKGFEAGLQLANEIKEIKVI
jgi:hypothetical protein